MRVRSDDPAWRVEFVFRGDERTGSTLPVEARPQTWIRAVLAGMAGTFLWGAVWSGPVALVQPGPLGVLVTALIAIMFGAYTAVAVARFMARFDTVEKPWQHNLAGLMSEARAERPIPERLVETDLSPLWAAAATVDSPTPDSLFRRSHASRVSHRPPSPGEEA